MAQRLKDEVRDGMLEAARTVFARDGYRGATMAKIAGAAGISTGNLYRYFATKDALFAAAIPAELAERFIEVVRQRVEALVATSALDDGDDDVRARAESLLQFWIAHRLEVITLLDRSDGSVYDGFASRFAELLVTAAMKRLRARARPKRLRPVVRLTLQTVFRNTVRSVVTILETHDSEADIRAAFAAFWSFQLAGLAGLEHWATS